MPPLLEPSGPGAPVSLSPVVPSVPPSSDVEELLESPLEQPVAAAATLKAENPATTRPARESRRPIIGEKPPQDGFPRYVSSSVRV
jgi:hypothetical protein